MKQIRNVLVLGGTRFFGKGLVELLINNGDRVTIATRGNQPAPFGDQVTRVRVDRSDRKAMEVSFEDTRWDVVYDQICYSPSDAKIACDVFKEKTKQYILTSTLSVYEWTEKASKVEKDFDPYKYSVQMGNRAEFNYGEGKRLAEAVFFQQATFPVTAVRPPIVLGEDDYTERLHDHVRKVLKEEPIFINEAETKLSFVEADDLAAFLFWVGTKDLCGPVNASAPDQITLGSLLELIESRVGKKAVIQKPQDKENQSPFNFPASNYQDVSLVTASGYAFHPITEWLPDLVESIAKTIPR